MTRRVVITSKYKMEHCVSHLRRWLDENSVSCNEDKTEVMVVTSLLFRYPLQLPIILERQRLYPVTNI